MRTGIHYTLTKHDDGRYTIAPVTSVLGTAPTGEETLRSSAWLDEAPPATPESEGWWWVKWGDRKPTPALVSYIDGGLTVRPFGQLHNFCLAAYDPELSWGGRIAVPGASSSDPSSATRGEKHG